MDVSFEMGISNFCTKPSRLESGLSETTSGIFSFIYIMHMHSLETKNWQQTGHRGGAWPF